MRKTGRATFNSILDLGGVVHPFGPVPEADGGHRSERIITKWGLWPWLLTALGAFGFRYRSAFYQQSVCFENGRKPFGAESGRIDALQRRDSAAAIHRRRKRGATVPI